MEHDSENMVHVTAKIGFCVCPGGLNLHNNCTKGKRDLHCTTVRMVKSVYKTVFSKVMLRSNAV